MNKEEKQPIGKLASGCLVATALITLYVVVVIVKYLLAGSPEVVYPMPSDREQIEAGADQIDNFCSSNPDAC